MPTVGFVGVGRIGEPMAHRLIAAGHDVTFHSRRPDVRQRLHSLGGRPADTAADLAACDIVISCLYSDAEMLEVAPEIIGGMHPGGVFVSHTTGTTMALEQLAVAAAARSVGVVDAGFSGNYDDVRAGTLTLFLGGATADVDRAMQVLGAYSAVLVRAGGLGAGMRVKMLNNLAFAAISQSTLNILRTGVEMGIEETALLRALQAGSGGSAAANFIQKCGGTGAFIARVEPYLAKDVDVAARTAAELHADANAALAAAAAGPMHLVPRGDGARPASDIEPGHLGL